MDTRRSWIFIGLVILCLIDPTRAQLLETFSDDDLTNDPNWSGDHNHWVINQEKELQLFRSESGESSLWTEYVYPEEGEFHFYFRMDFSPSSSNATRLFLWSSAPSENADTALWVKLGESGQEDRLRFYWRSDGRDSLIASLDPVQTEEPVHCRVRVTRNQQMTFAVYSTEGKDSYEGFTPVEWPDLPAGESYFGIIANYTSTRGSSFFFDDLMIDLGDDEPGPPDIRSLAIVGGEKVELVFEKPVLPDTLDLSITVEAEGATREIDHLEWTEGRACYVTLFLQNELNSGDELTLRIDGLSDVFGGILVDWDTTFIYLPVELPSEGDLRINEIYCKPTESGLLPNAEYLEILNNSRKKIDLAGVRVGDATGSADPLEKRILLPQEILLLCDEDHLGLFPDSINRLGVKGFPSLNNSGDDLYLYDIDGELIDRVSYEDDMYRDALKKEGGWSLENINPNADCTMGENWIASIDALGGTPGRANSTFTLEPPTDHIGMKSINIPDDQTIIIEFDKPIDQESIVAGADWRIEPPLEIIESNYSAQLDNLELWTGAPMERGLLYRIFAHPDLKTCLGQSTDTTDNLEFGIPEVPTPGEIVINEVLYDPHKNGNEFVELYNTTNGIFHTDSIRLYLIKEDQSTSEIDFHIPMYIRPLSYPLVTEDPGGVVPFYSLPEYTIFLLTDMPSLPNTGGMLELRNLRGELLDAVTYHEDMHAEYMDETKGVSLERLSPSLPGGSATNWHSAASMHGGASPMRENSQRVVINSAESSVFDLISPTFSPDQDGFEDQMLISYRLESEGYRAVIRIFDQAGYLVRTLVNHESLGKEGVLSWDGTDEMGHICKIGMYFVQIELNLTGESVQSEMLAVVLAHPLDNK